MDESTLWWIVAGLLVVAELVTGTFYLLMLALGAVAGALAAHGAMAVAVQILAAAAVGGGASAGWHLWRRSHTPPPGMPGEAETNLDVGQTVQVIQWQGDGSTRVNYRGAQWAARLAPGAASTLPQPGAYRISGVDGSQLLLEKI
ncbi:MAG: NfeD family protein [Rubrivivax sp.]|nr:MAG: NfeD family protein [Rubrivivax sp.]